MSWLDALARALELGRNKTVLLVADAVVSGLRPLVRRLHAVDPRVVVALRADELPALPENALVLLAADAADLAWLNANRPFVAHRRLRLVLWWPGTTREARETASDLLSWASEVLSCPQAPAGYAVRAFEALAEHRPGSIWPRALLQAVLDDRGRAAQRISGELGVDELARELRALTGRVPVFEGVSSPAQRRAIVQALMEVEPPGPYVLVDAPVAEGWCAIEAPAGLGELVAEMPANVPVAARQRLAVGLEGEPRAAVLAGEVLAAGGDAEELFAVLLGADDPLEVLSARIEGGAARVDCSRPAPGRRSSARTGCSYGPRSEASRCDSSLMRSRGSTSRTSMRASAARRRGRPSKRRSSAASPRWRGGSACRIC